MSKPRKKISDSDKKTKKKFTAIVKISGDNIIFNKNCLSAAYTLENILKKEYNISFDTGLIMKTGQRVWELDDVSGISREEKNKIIDILKNEFNVLILEN